MCASPPSMPLTGISFRRCSKEVHKHYPNISFTLTTINNIHIQQALISGEGGFRHHAQSPEPPVELQVRAFAEMNIPGSLVPPGHPLDKPQRRCALISASDYPFIIPSAPH